MYIGIRDIDDFEKKVIKHHNIKYITCNEVNNNLEKSLKIINNFVENNPVHLSFDVDCMDPGIIPCTGTRFKEGLNFNVKNIVYSKPEVNTIPGQKLSYQRIRLNYEEGDNFISLNQ